MRRKWLPPRFAAGFGDFFSRLRRPSLRRAGVAPKWSGLVRWRISGWILACFGLVAVLATLQFEWIGQVSDSQLRAATANLRVPMYSSTDRFKDLSRLLMWTFRPDADIDPSKRSQNYSESYLSWHVLSNHGLAIRRILFYDTFPDGRRELTELVGEPPGLKPASWDGDLAHARRHIDGSHFRPDRFVNSRWTVTWMFNPRAMALYRPIVRQDPGSGGQSGSGHLTGYLILQLDLDILRDWLIPEILSNKFRRWSNDRRYAVAVAFDDRSLFIYDPVEASEAERRMALGQFRGYALRPQSQTEETYEIGVPDSEIELELLADRLSESLVRRGAVQRVSLRTRLDLLQLIGPGRGSPGMLTRRSAPGNLGNDEKPLRVEWSGYLPRLVVVDDAPHRVYLRAKLLGFSTREAVNRQYKRSVTMGILVLLLLIGAMAMVALSARRAERLAAMRIETAASQSHQLRTPLAGISLLADNMVRGALGSGTKVITYGEQMREYGRQLSELVDRTVQLAAMDSPLRQYHLSMVDVSEVAQEALEQARAMIESAGFEAECSCPEGLASIRADREALRHCLGELLANAVKYGHPGRWVRIETEEAGSGSKREVRIHVCDRGPGISAREARMIFEPFYRAPEVNTSSIPGSGLGLALARSTLEGMGGKLTLKTHPGRGSVFSIHFDAS